MFKKVWLLWKLFTRKMAQVQTGIVLFFIYFVVIGLVALPMRLFGKDFLSRGERYDHSFWYKKDEVSHTLEDQMKQF
jgi:hypothetical protein